MQNNAVTQWFGPQFAQLDPLLQTLHQHGGVLRGEVTITHGKGLAGWIGKRLSRKLGIPVGVPECDFEVTIRHSKDALFWNRRFANGGEMTSVFQPVGTWPDGYWIEKTGFVSIKLTVEVIEGGWYWRILGISIGGMPVPLWLFPRSKAYKRIEQGKYCFYVGFDWPLLDTLLSYSGLLVPQVLDR